jgi:hypothetical protein
MVPLVWSELQLNWLRQTLADHCTVVQQSHSIPTLRVLLKTKTKTKTNPNDDKYHRHCNTSHTNANKPSNIARRMAMLRGELSVASMNTMSLHRCMIWTFTETTAVFCPALLRSGNYTTLAILYVLPSHQLRIKFVLVCLL